jgi:hypothetical protein
MWVNRWEILLMSDDNNENGVIAKAAVNRNEEC